MFEFDGLKFTRVTVFILLCILKFQMKWKTKNAVWIESWKLGEYEIKHIKYDYI